MRLTIGNIEQIHTCFVIKTNNIGTLQDRVLWGQGEIIFKKSKSQN
jgi:hypothetical protein